ncbi:unnamed protein product [Calypogeia fissa]
MGLPNRSSISKTLLRVGLLFIPNSMLQSFLAVAQKPVIFQYNADHQGGGLRFQVPGNITAINEVTNADEGYGLDDNMVDSMFPLGNSLWVQYDGQGVYIRLYFYCAEKPGWNVHRRLRCDGRSKWQRIINILVITIPSVSACLVLVFIIVILYKRNAKLSALAKKYEIEEEALNRGCQKFKYRVLSAATKGFSADRLLGSGGSGSVYKEQVVLKGETKQSDVAVKRISAKPHQGAQEFVAEVKIIGQAQHRHLVRLLGWCNEYGELLLLYDYMPNGSVDQHLYHETDSVLTWSRRLKIVSGVATALAYLHEEWEQRVNHRDVKSSNVMLDRDLNARLGDFGLARLSRHDQAPPSTAVLAGTYGYMAPELAHTLKPTEKTDVYSFGALVLEMATGRQPLLSKDDRESFDEILLVNWVWSLYRDDALGDAADCRLKNAYEPGEMVMFLKIGLLCSHPNPDERPSMREVLNIWKGSPFPLLPRSKPVPIFPLSTDDSGIDTEQYGDTTLLYVDDHIDRTVSVNSQRFSLDFADSYRGVKISSDPYAHSAPSSEELNRGNHGGYANNSSLRRRPRTITSLPL